MALTTILIGPSRAAFADHCGPLWWPTRGALETVHPPGSNTYTATFRFNLTTEQVQALGCLSAEGNLERRAQFVEIDFQWPCWPQPPPPITTGAFPTTTSQTAVAIDGDYGYGYVSSMYD